MKIAFFIEHISNGGAERVITNLANSFAKHNHEVIMITTIRRLGEYSLSENVRRFTTEGNAYHTSKLIGPFRRLYRLRSILKKEKPQYLVSFLNSALYHGVLTTRGLKTKSIISVRNDPNFDYQTILQKILAKTILPLSEGAVFQTEDAKAWFPKQLQDKSTIIFNPISSSFYNTNYIPMDKLIVAVGRLSEQKDYFFLIKGFKVFADAHKDWKLHIYGDGELKEQLSGEIKRVGLADKIILKGRTDNVANAISSATIYVMTSQFEGSPNALMEAMAVGVPCISSNCPCGGPKMLINNGNNGFLYEVGNIDEFLDRLNVLAENSELRIKFSKSAKNRAKDFTEEKVDAQRVPMGIDDLEGRELIIKNIRVEVQSKHSIYHEDSIVDQILLPFLKYESTGTIKMLSILPLIFAALESGRPIVIDELENGLHPNIVQRILDLFKSPEMNPFNSQLICTTHSIALAERGVRRDQVWVISKDAHGKSSMKRISEYPGTRTTDNIAEKYLRCAFGDVPRFS